MLTDQLLRTLPGRTIIIGAAVKVAVFVVTRAAGATPPLLAVVDTVAGLAIAVAGAYLVVASLVSARRRLLWRVSRKLIISYVFIGFVPALLIVAFFVLAGLLLFSNFSSYVLQARLRAVADRAQAIAERTTLEVQRVAPVSFDQVLGERRQAVEREFPGASFVVVRAARRCPAGGAAADGAADNGPLGSAGAWSHVEPPRMVPQWIGCDGFAGLLPYQGGAPAGAGGSGGEPRLVARAVVFPKSPAPSFAIVVDLPVNDELRQRLRSETGVLLSAVGRVGDGVNPLPGRPGGVAPRADTTANALPLNSVSFLETRDWTTGASGELMASLQLNVRDMYDRIFAAQGSAGQSFRQGLLVALLVIGSLLLVIQFIALVAGLALARSITGSVHELFVGTERVRRGDFTHKIAVASNDQLGELAGSFNTMTTSIEDLLRESAEKKRLEEELRIAHEIQMSLLPQGPLRMPGLSVATLCVPAREVGGDYYDFLPLDRHRLGLLVADVSGKGTSAALYMAELKGLVLSLSRIHSSPRELLVAANRLIAEHLDARSFITMTYAILDLDARTMTYARAGHTPLIHVPGPGARSRQAQVLAPDGLVLGLKIDAGEMFERLLEEETIPLRAGDLYLFFTDGITEAMNDRDDCFGEQRLARLVEEHANLPPTELRERVLGEIAAFVGDAPQHDDMTMILLKIEEPAEPSSVGAVVAGGMHAGIGG